MPRKKVFAAALALPDQERAELMNELARTFLAPKLSKAEESGLLDGLRQIDDGTTISGDLVHEGLRKMIRHARSRRR